MQALILHGISVKKILKNSRHSKLRKRVERRELISRITEITASWVATIRLVPTWDSGTEAHTESIYLSPWLELL